MNKIEYRPVRVIQGISVGGDDAAALKEKFPHAEPEAVRGKKSATHSRRFRPGMVVNAPTRAERELFDSLSDEVVAEIPQHRDGYDDPRSDLARSREGSARGRESFLVELAERGELKPPAAGRPPKRAATSSKKPASEKKRKSGRSSRKGGDK